MGTSIDRSGSNYLWALSFGSDINASDTVTLIGRILSYGIMCGVVGINVAHELGHKTNKTDQFLAKVLLTTTLYTHFFLSTTLVTTKMLGRLRILLRHVEVSGCIRFGYVLYSSVICVTRRLVYSVAKATYLKTRWYTIPWFNWHSSPSYLKILAA